MTKILVVCQGYLGHLIPAIGTVKELKKRNHEVWLTCFDKQKELVVRAGVDFLDTSLDLAPSKRIEDTMNELLQIIKEKEIELILCDSTMSAPAYAAELLDLPWISFSTTVQLTKQLPGKEETNLRLRYFYKRILNKARERFNMLPLEDMERTRGDWAGLSPFLHLVMVYPIMEIDSDIPSHFKYVGPCTFENEISKPVINIDPEKPTILITHTSLINSDYAKITQKYVYDSIKALGNSHYNVLITSSEDFLSDIELPKNIQVINNSPVHETLLPLTDILITHGGCNTLQKGLRYGVPMLIIPLGDDHHIISKHCKSLGVGEILEFNEITPNKILNGIQSILAEPNYQHQSKKIHSMYQNFNPNQESADAIEQFITNYL
ncbi:glycosyltransferase [Cytobacillus oceanisediminis]|uniref:glycosyltransferase n=1 Tax=Cytobacillus oceanisediminis TaxID=665099 RepID=UPI001C210ED2|nr:nucleotide disphospho-sugar-binding domain-containing protein [Cytobacillus oceanisediminis]MBU8772064.1 hypothetical protein [Cytobacillus oceanisediminis]